jgi:hypothetical protein
MPVTGMAAPDTAGKTPPSFAVTLKYCIGWDVASWWL